VAYLDNDILEYKGDYYCSFDDDFWVWWEDPGIWKSLDFLPDFLTVVNDRLALLDEWGHHYCNCPFLVMHNRGCLCGGL